MRDFPEFMRNPRNAIAAEDQSRGVVGYVYDGADGSQMAHWRCEEAVASSEHVHDYDEYFVVVQGEYTLIIEGRRIILRAGDEYYLPRGLPHAGESTAGTRTIHAFGGKRASTPGMSENRD